MIHGTILPALDSPHVKKPASALRWPCGPAKALHTDPVRVYP